MASFTILGADAVVGTSTFLCSRLPISTVRIPASTKRIPANNTCVQVSPEGIRKNAYPSLIQGEALPHRKVHTSARAQTTQVFCRSSVFFVLTLSIFLLTSAIFEHSLHFSSHNLCYYTIRCHFPPVFAVFFLQ